MWYLRLSFMAVIYFELNYVCSRYPVASFSMKFLPHFQYRLTDNTHTRVCVNAKKSRKMNIPFSYVSERYEVECMCALLCPFIFIGF